MKINVSYCVQSFVLPLKILCLLPIFMAVPHMPVVPSKVKDVRYLRSEVTIDCKLSFGCWLEIHQLSFGRTASVLTC